MPRRIYYNCHTHIFNVHVLPENIMGPTMGYIIKALKFGQLPFWALSFLKMLGIFSDGGGVERLKMFFQSFSQGPQEDVFKHLVSLYSEFAYDKEFRFVVLSQDMDSNGVAKPKEDIYRQVEDLSEIKNCNLPTLMAEKMMPFIGINPHTHPTSQSIIDFVKHYIEKRGFSGVKIYPSSGYFADDEKLMPLWAYCSSNEIPIMTHCTCGPIYFRGDLKSRLGDKVRYPELSDNKVAQANFTDMHYFKKVLSVYPKLKICFAHCGGASVVKAYQYSAERRVAEIQKEWYKQLKEMCLQYDNVYCDISFLNSDKDRLLEIKSDFDSGKLNKDRLLYGTDFFVNMHKTSEHMAFNRTVECFDFLKIGSSNPAKYLTSKLQIAPEII